MLNHRIIVAMNMKPNFGLALIRISGVTWHSKIIWVRHDYVGIPKETIMPRIKLLMWLDHGYSWFYMSHIWCTWIDTVSKPQLVNIESFCSNITQLSPINLDFEHPTATLFTTVDWHFVVHALKLQVRPSIIVLDYPSSHYAKSCPATVMWPFSLIVNRIWLKVWMCD